MPNTPSHYITIFTTLYFDSSKPFLFAIPIIKTNPVKYHSHHTVGNYLDKMLIVI